MECKSSNCHFPNYRWDREGIPCRALDDGTNTQLGYAKSEGYGRTIQPDSEIRRDLPIPLPPANEQKRIVAELDRQITYLERTVLLVDSSSIRNSRARQSILTAAFTGQLVPQDPADEPASALLERIRAEREMSESRKRVNLGKQNGKNPEEAGSRRMKESWK